MSRGRRRCGATCELLPVEEPQHRLQFRLHAAGAGRTRLARELGVAELYIKDDSVNHPTFSYKDRVVSVAATRAVELGFPVFGCASTGNLAGSVAAHAARLGLPCYVFIPHDLEPAKVLGASIYRPHVVAVEGNYDDVNRLCTQIADRYGWGFANINLRSYYAEGAKTMGFEIAEQLGWRYPGSHRLARGRRHAAAADLQGAARAARGGPGRAARCRASMRRSRRARRRWSTRSKRAWSSPTRSSRTRSRSRWRSAIRRTGSRW